MADLGSILGSAGIGGSIGKAIVSLELDTKKYQAELKAAQAQTDASTNSMSSGLAAFGGIAKAGIAAAAIGVVAFGAHAIKAASDQGEALNKSNVIFGQNAAAIAKWAQGGAAGVRIVGDGSTGCCGELRHDAPIGRRGDRCLRQDVPSRSSNSPAILHRSTTSTRRSLWRSCGQA